MGYSKLKDAIVNAKSGDNWFMDLVNKKASPEAKERIEKGIATKPSTSFFTTTDGRTVPFYTDETGIVTVYESELKKMTEDDNLTRYDAQLREYGIAEYSNATFDNINTYKFLGRKVQEI